MASKLSKLQYSNNAHDRLCNKWFTDHSVIGKTKWYYHATVKEKQQKRGSIMPRNERKGLFRRILAGVKKGEYT